MKGIICFAILAALAASGAQAYDAREWRATIKATDDLGRPVDGARVSIFYDVPLNSTDHGKITGLTDTNGIFAASHRDETFGLRFVITKAGTYPVEISEDFHGPPLPNQLTKNLRVTLKRVINPIPMYAKRLNTHVPVEDKAAGFDLEVGDWVAPYGKGVKNDINFTAHFKKKPGGESDFTLTVSFPKPGDGIQEFAVLDAEKGSAIRSPLEAPANGYVSQWVQIDNRIPGKPIDTNRSPQRNYFFRIRTVLDEQGNLKSAQYGKIYGDFMQFTYYLNPAPNDRNVEFDTKRNLFKYERADAP